MARSCRTDWSRNCACARSTRWPADGAFPALHHLPPALGDRSGRHRGVTSWLGHVLDIAAQVQALRDGRHQVPGSFADAARRASRRGRTTRRCT
ncbi:hypothetical protein ACU4GD_20650 [Cupriavidus basilensis]